jgi:alpha-tubulin suppressor-like RCC1 family protein
LDGTGVVCWGRNLSGQTDVPPDLSNPAAVSTGNNHTCALDDSGVVCWGDNTYGQRVVPFLTNPVAITTGNAHTCARDDTGVVCWGAGTTDTGSSLEFGQSIVPPLSNPVAVEAGGYHTCAQDDTGVVCWGRNNFGQTAVPTGNFDTDGDGVWDGIDAFPLDPEEWLDSDGDGTGNNADTDDDNDTIPDVYDQPPGRDPLVADWLVDAGSSHNCALDDSGVVCWGRNSNGQSTVPALSNPVLVSAGGFHTCALDDEGVVCWGGLPRPLS